MGDQEIEIYRGDNKTYEVTVVDADGAAFNLTGARIVFSVKSTTNDATYKFQLTSDTITEIEITDAVGGIFKVYLVPDNTNLLRPSKYVYDIEVQITGKIYTIIKDDFQIRAEVTRP
jgi:hypothetical protein